VVKKKLEKLHGAQIGDRDRENTIVLENEEVETGGGGPTDESAKDKKEKPSSWRRSAGN